MAKTALIAGKGKLPLYLVRTAVSNGININVLNITGKEKDSLTYYAEDVFAVDVGNLGGIIDYLLENEIEKVVFAGKVEKNSLFQLELDRRMKVLLNNLENYNDDTILRAIALEMEKEGIEIIPQSELLTDLLAIKGNLTEGEISHRLRGNMEYAFKMAREIGKLDIGQTVLTKDKAVIAVEAAEGTDSAILRAGDLAGDGIVMAKVSKPEQDFRFDIPTVGLQTITNLKKINAEGLILEANKTFILDKNKVLEEANKAGIKIAAVEHTAGGIIWDK